MKVISWNLLRLTGAAVEDVASLLEREKPDVLLMQEVTEHMDVLPSLVAGHFHRQPWPGRWGLMAQAGGWIAMGLSPALDPGLGKSDHRIDRRASVQVRQFSGRLVWGWRCFPQLVGGA